MTSVRFISFLILIMAICVIALADIPVPDPAPGNNPAGINGAITRQPPAPLTQSQAQDRTKGSLWVLPAPFYSPETQIGLNLLMFKVFPYDEEKNSTNSSNILGYATYTTNLQFVVSTTPIYYWDHGKNLFAGEMGFKNWPDRFYGIGNSTSTNYEDYTIQIAYLRPRFYRDLFSKFSMGPFYELEDDVMTVISPGYSLATGTVPGTNNPFQSGLGLGLRWDSRDIPFFPTTGVLVEASATSFSSLFGSSVDYTRLTLDGHRYFSLAPHHIIALEAYWRSTAGNVPFEAMSILGGNQYLRGIYGGRFRDKDSIIAQIEYRFPIHNRLSGAAFGGMGEVADQPYDFDTSHVQSATGAGLRYFLDVHEQLNVRLDFGIAPGSNGVYLAVGEAI